jgi:3-methyladenine DNA glycosylase/8-oxoguanine DNA glycosylase
MARSSFIAASRELAGRDPDLARMVALAGPPRLRARHPDGVFGALVHAITYQQLSGASAAAIVARFRAAVGGRFTPESVAAASDADLRAAGLSAAKLAAVRDLAAKALDGTVPLTRLGRLSDEEIVARLSAVRGIGRWTAEMLLLFELRRLDVWPTGDLGVRTGYGLVWGVSPTPTPKQLEGLGDRFRPYRSVAAWYCWRAVHLQRAGVALADP